MEYSTVKRLWNTQWPHCTVRTIGFVALPFILGPTKSHYVQLYTVQLGCCWSHSSVTFRESAIWCLGWSWKLKAYRWTALGTLGGGCMKQSLSLGYSMWWSFLLILSRSFKPSFKSHEPCLLDVGSSVLSLCSSELPLVTPIGHFQSSSCSSGKDTLLMEGGSGVEVLFSCDIHCNLLLAISLCCLKNLLVTTLPCHSLTV